MQQKSIRAGYEELGVKGFYAAHGSTYVNPHYASLCACLSKLLDSLLRLPQLPSLSQALAPFIDSTTPLELLDLACGSGEGSRALIQVLPRVISRMPQFSLPFINLEACDPYTLDAFAAALSANALPESIKLTRTHSFSFEEMQGTDDAAFTLTTHFHWTIISFALHLANSTFHGVLTTLANQSRLLFVLGPGKNVIVERRHGWALLGYCCVERVHGWIYESIFYQ